MAKDCQPQQKITAASAIILEAGLSFLGLGDPTLMSLGSLASNAQRFLRVAWWMVLFPGATIAAAAVALECWETR